MRVATREQGVGILRGGISIHATHAGGDVSPVRFGISRRYFNPRHPCGWRPRCHSAVAVFAKFQSTPPMRVATSGMSLAEQEGFISIHATHAGGDGKVFFPTKFQSTPPMRVATDAVALVLQTEYISIHATHAGGDGNALAN